MNAGKVTRGADHERFRVQTLTGLDGVPDARAERQADRLVRSPIAESRVAELPPPDPASARRLAPASRRATLRTVAALIVLGGVFWAGAWLYVHVGGRLLGEDSALPAPLLLALALVGGAASFFSPCSIAITPSFLLYLLGGGQSSQRGQRAAVHAAGPVALGIVSFYALAGLLVGALGAVVYNYLVYLVAAVGLAFLALGYVLLSGGSPWLAALARRNPATGAYERMLAPRAARRPARLYAFGCAYGAASHTCTLPIFLGVVLVPLTTGAWWLAAGTTVVYGAAIALLLLTLSILGDGVLSAVRRRIVGHYLELATGTLFIATGAYLVYYFLVNYGQLP